MKTVFLWNQMQSLQSSQKFWKYWPRFKNLKRNQYFRKQCLFNKTGKIRSFINSILFFTRWPGPIFHSWLLHDSFYSEKWKNGVKGKKWDFGDFRFINWKLGLKSFYVVPQCKFIVWTIFPIGSHKRGQKFFSCDAVF